MPDVLFWVLAIAWALRAIAPSQERCNQCGGELESGHGVVALLRCSACGREVPATAILGASPDGERVERT